MPVFVALFIDIQHDGVVVDNYRVEVPLRHGDHVSKHDSANRKKENQASQDADRHAQA